MKLVSFQDPQPWYTDTKYLMNKQKKENERGKEWWEEEWKEGKREEKEKKEGEDFYLILTL